MDEARIKKNITFLKNIRIPLSEKLDKVIKPGLITSGRVIFQFIPDEDIKIPINRPKLWVSRIKKTSKNLSRTPKIEGGQIETMGNTVNRDGQSLLQQASYYGKISIIKKLLTEGADINQEDWNGSTALLYAIKANQSSSVKELIRSPRLNITQKYGNRHETALLKAVKLGYAEIVAEICKNSKEVVSKQDIDGRSPLFHSVIRGNTEMVLELVKAGSREKDLIDYKGNNAVFLAIEQGEVAAVQALLDYSEFDISEAICEKLLLMGCYGNNIELVQSALPHIGITHNVREEGLSPILISYSLGFTEITYFLLEYSINDEIDFISSQGDFLLIAACKKNDVKMVEKIVDERDCNTNLRDFNGRTGLHEACDRGYSEVVEALLRRSIDINIKDNLGNTPIMLACKRKYKHIVELLIKRGADIRGTDYLGKDIKIYATKEIIEILDHFAPAMRVKKIRKQIQSPIIMSSKSSFQNTR